MTAGGLGDQFSENDSRACPCFLIVLGLLGKKLEITFSAGSIHLQVGLRYVT